MKLPHWLHLETSSFANEWSVQQRKKKKCWLGANGKIIGLFLSSIPLWNESTLSNRAAVNRCISNLDGLTWNYSVIIHFLSLPVHNIDLKKQKFDVQPILKGVEIVLFSVWKFPNENMRYPRLYAVFVCLFSWWISSCLCEKKRPRCSEPGWCWNIRHRRSITPLSPFLPLLVLPQ